MPEAFELPDPSINDRASSPSTTIASHSASIASPSAISYAASFNDGISIDEIISAGFDKLDHRKVVSYHPHLNVDANGKKYQQYLVISRKSKVKPSFYLKEGIEKRGGREYPFARNVYVSGYEILDITFSNGKECWNGFISYDDHNLSRKRGTKDDTWTVEKFLPLIQSVLQFPEKFISLNISLTVEKNKEDKSLTLKIKTSKNGSVEHFIKPCRLGILAENEDPDVPTLSSKVFLDAFEINNRNLIVACRSDNLDVAMNIISSAKGNCDINCKDDHTQWSMFQWVCYNGFYDIANYLILEHKSTLDIHYRSPFDGNTAIHCAVMSGNLELVQLLILFDAKIIPNLNDETPPELALIHRHRSIVEYFYDEDSKICEDGRQLHGIRNKVITRMFTLREKIRIKPMEMDDFE